MLLQIDDSVLAFIKATPSNAAACKEALENLAIAHRKGLHLIVGDPAVFLWLYENFSCGDETRKSFLKLYNDAVQNSALVDDFSIFVKVVGYPLGTCRAIDDRGQTCITIQLSRFSTFDLCREPILLAENLTDIEVCLIFGRAYAAARGNTKILLKCDERPGGGSTTASIFTRIQSSNSRFCLCLVDSDKHSPLDALGETARQVVAAYEPHLGLSDMHVTDEHELENILPLNHVSKIYHGDYLKRISCDALKSIKDADPVLGDFIDLKAGISFKDILEMPKNSERRRYWEGKIDFLLAHGLLLREQAECIDGGVCAHLSQCRCIVVHPLGRTILEDFAVSLSGKTDARILQLLSEELLNSWPILGRKIYERFCCSEGYTL